MSLVLQLCLQHAVAGCACICTAPVISLVQFVMQICSHCGIVTMIQRITPSWTLVQAPHHPRQIVYNDLCAASLLGKATTALV